ncbi:MAG: aminopeptidase P family protein [Phycisphaeraceae bacterium]|nr:aminopeptidase P family protein [Phycisphaeraceae bacterium]
MLDSSSTFAAAQDLMRQRGIDGWLVHDFRGSNPTLRALLGGIGQTTRRVTMLVPAAGPARLLCHELDHLALAAAGQRGVRVDRHVSWPERDAWLDRELRGMKCVAMEYSPACELPVVGIVDAGTVEAVRSRGVEVVSSADLVQATVAVWSAAAVEEHARASRLVGATRDAMFEMVRQRLRAGQRVLEHEAADFVRSRFAADGLEWPDGPIVAVDAHTADPHYEPGADNPTPIVAGSWVMLDLWARVPGESNIFSDITWMAFAGARPSDEHMAVFESVKRARDAALRTAKDGWSAGREVEGWQLDRAAREEIDRAGFGAHVLHRTGHSLSPGPKVHGLGMNLDDLETHDTRRMLPGLGYTIEPGVYIKGRFGCRSEINVYIDPAKGPVVTCDVQSDLVHLT